MYSYGFKLDLGFEVAVMVSSHTLNLLGFQMTVRVSKYNFGFKVGFQIRPRVSN